MRFAVKFGPVATVLIGVPIIAASCTVADKGDYTFEDNPGKGGRSGGSAGKAGSGGKAGGGTGGTDGSGGDPGAGADSGGKGGGNASGGKGTGGSNQGGEAGDIGEGGTGLVPDDPCDPDPCDHGYCELDGQDGYKCECEDGYTGPQCQTNIDDCENDPCQHGGVCSDAVDDYVCDCSMTGGYTGKNCQTLATAACEEMPCLHGTCTDVTGGGFQCNCMGTGYEGDTCEQDIDECARELDNCDQLARCDDRDGTFTCTCAAPYYDLSNNGTRCSPFNTCDQLYAAYSYLPSGRYPILTGSGTVQDAYCHMVLGVGGFTNLDPYNWLIWLADDRHYIQCLGGLYISENSIECYRPRFNGQNFLYLRSCDNSDGSANYVRDYVGPLLGLPGRGNLGGFASVQATSDYSEGSSIFNEYCYVSGQVVQYLDPACAAYVMLPDDNADCTPTYLGFAYDMGSGTL